jgi:hypothetical protein
MSRFLHQAVSTLTMAGYWLIITWGPLWHDHRHCHSHAPCGEAECRDHTPAEHTHCCAHHHHPNCGSETKGSSSPSPCDSPLHDEGCPVCQILAHPPLSAPEVAVVEVSVPVEAFVPAPAPLAERAIPAAYDSRGPPMA